MTMKKHKWTEQEKEYLRENYREGDGLSKCVAHFGVSVNAVKKIAARIGVSGTHRSFTADEIGFIKENYWKLGLIETAKILGVKKSSVNTLVTKRLFLRMDAKERGKITSRTNKLWIRSDITKKKLSEKASLRVRSANPNWKGGITPLRTIVRRLSWAVWILPVMKRDNYQCQECGSNSNLNVHHLRPYRKIQKEIVSKHPELDLSMFSDRNEMALFIVQEHKLSDGITLCVECHKKRHFVKRGELRETLTAKGEGNPQPSQPNVIEYVGWKAQRLMDEDSQTNKSNTSAPNTFTAGVMR